MKFQAVIITAAISLLCVHSVVADSTVAARVNGKPITVAEIDRLATRIASGAKTPVENVWNDARDQQVTLEVLVQEANAEKLSVSPADVDKEIEEFKTQIGGPQQFQKTLDEAKSTDAQFREDTRRSLLAGKLLDKHVTVKVDDKQIEAYYKENQDQFEHPELVRASHILVKIVGGDKAAAEKRAADILARAKAGEDFAKLAKETSDDERTKNQGGDLGFFPRRSTPVAEAAFQLKPGQISDVVESTYGLHIIKVVDQRDAGTAPLAEVKDQIRTTLEDDTREDKEDAYIDQLKKAAKIEILVDKKAAANAGNGK